MPIRNAALLSLLFAGTAACGSDFTVPAPLLSVNVTGATDSAGIHTRTDGSTDVVCRVRFRAVSTGDPGVRARWQGGVFRFYTGGDRATVVDSIPLTGEYLTLLLGNVPLGPAYDRTTVYQVVRREPFTVQAEFRYHVIGTGDEERTATGLTECRPA